MVVLWPCRKPRVSQCPGWHNKAKAKAKSVACRTDHKLNEAPVAYTAEVDKNDESREAVGPVYDA